MVLAPKLGQFVRDYPDVVLDVTTTEEGRFDLVGAGFDAGIHLGEFIERDMVAVRVSNEQRAAIARRAELLCVTYEAEVAAAI
jgi:DNA-binding transcriptional LysR family regulator